MSTWFYAKGGQTLGPVGEGEFRNLINLGTVGPDDLVWKEGMPAWQPASTIPGLPFPPAGRVPPPPVPSSEPSIPVVPANSFPPASTHAPGPAIPDYLPWSIAATLLCCLPAGIAAIYYSVKANSARTTGNFEVARQQAQVARKWLIAAVAIGIVFTIIYLIILIVGGMHAAQQQ